MVGTFMGPFDGSVVNIALPSLATYFDVPLTTLEWVVVAYLLAISTLVLTWGRVGDIVGLRKVYLGGYLVFVFGSLLCAFSWGIWSLVAFRVVQALGAGMLFAVGPAIVTRAFPPSERGRALGFVGVAVAAGLAMGPTLGGLIIDALGWQWIFLVNVPIGLVACLLAVVVLSPAAPVGQRFDPAGAVFSFLTLFPLLLALSKGEAWGWSNPLVWGLLVLAALSGVAFVMVEVRVPQPVLDFDLFRIRVFSLATLAAISSYIVLATIMFTLPFYLQDARGFSVARAGLLLTPVPFMTAIVGPLSGALSDRIGSRVLSTVGLLISTTALLSMRGLDLQTDTGGILLRLALVGLGGGLFQAPNSSAILGSVPRPRLGVASGIVATARNVGMLLGVSLAAVVLAIREPVHLSALPAGLPAAQASRQAFVLAMHDALLVAAVISLLGVLASWLRSSAAVSGDTLAASASPPG